MQIQNQFKTKVNGIKLQEGYYKQNDTGDLFYDMLFFKSLTKKE